MACKPCQKRLEDAKQYNVFNAAADVVRNAVSGKSTFVSKDIENDRLNICLNCPSNDYNEKLHICNVCKCHVKTKVKFPKSSCPKGHWGAIDPDVETSTNEDETIA